MIYKRTIQISILVSVALFASSYMSREEIAAREAAREATIAAIPTTSSQDLCQHVGVKQEGWPHSFYSHLYYNDNRDEFIQELKARSIDAVFCSAAGIRCISNGNEFGSGAFRKCAFEEARADETMRLQAEMANELLE